MSLVGHDFASKHFSSPTWCILCKNFIWGLGKQGCQCNLCHYTAHKKCLSKVDILCPKVPQVTLEE